MGMSASSEITQLQQQQQVPRWCPATRVAFRFCFVYFGLFCLATQILGSLMPIPKVDIPDLQSLWPIRPVILWVAAHILRIAHPIAYADTGSGDKTFDWIVSARPAERCRCGDGDLVFSRSTETKLRHAAQMVPAFHSLFACIADDHLRHGQNHSIADAVSISDEIIGAIRQFLTDGRSMVVNRFLACVRDLRGLRGNVGWNSADRSADSNAGSARLPRGHHPGLRTQHDVRCARKTSFLSLVIAGGDSART